MLRPRVRDCGRHPTETAGQEEICDPSSSKQRYSSASMIIAPLGNTRLNLVKGDFHTPHHNKKSVTNKATVTVLFSFSVVFK